jgi:hypothetical protein
MGFGAGLVACKRPDLIGEILAGGGLLVALYFGTLLLLDRLIVPGWIACTWNFHTFSGVQIVGVPAEDLLWAFTIGAVCAPLYEVLMGCRVTRIQRSHGLLS